MSSSPRLPLSAVELSPHPLYLHMSTPSSSRQSTASFTVRNTTSTGESIAFKIRIGDFPDSHRLTMAVSQKTGAVEAGKGKTVQLWLRQTTAGEEGQAGGRMEMDIYFAWQWRVAIRRAKERLRDYEPKGTAPLTDDEYEWWRKIKVNLEQIRVVVSSGEGEGAYWADPALKSASLEDFLKTRRSVLRDPFPPTDAGLLEQRSWESEAKQTEERSKNQFAPLLITNKKLPFDPKNMTQLTAYMQKSSQEHAELVEEVTELFDRDLHLLTGLVSFENKAKAVGKAEEEKILKMK